LTDLPIRQVYYLDDSRTAEVHRGLGDYGLLVACNDDRAYDYFMPSPAVAACRLSDDAPDLSDPRLARIVSDVVRQLELVHGSPIPAPRWVALRDWGKDPYGGGYHGWLPGHRSWELTERLRRPVPSANLFICGSAFSDLPTWMEGALGNTERLLREVLELESPNWLNDDCYLGW
jgi:monoamine oxidase